MICINVALPGRAIKAPMQPKSQARRQPSTIRGRLIALVVISALPVWIASAALLFNNYVEERSFIERDARATVRALMLSVDRDLATAVTAAQVLATSRDL